MVSKYLTSARDTLDARRMLNLIIITKETFDSVIHSVVKFKSFVKNGHCKREKLLSPRVVISVDNEFGILSYAHRFNGLKIFASIEDTGVAITDEDVPAHFFEYIDKINDSIDYDINCFHFTSSSKAVTNM